ncbi:MAG: sugar ABC transporter substrate-binding protein [Candidatus Nanopelagicales bacterium]
MLRRLVTIPASLLAVAVMLAACSSSSPSTSSSSPASGGQTVGFLVFDAELDTFVTALVDAVDGAAQARGLQLTVVDGKNDAATQTAAVQQFIADGVDAILLYPGDPTTLMPVVKEAADKGIPVFTVNLNLEKGAPIITYVGSDDYDYGKEQAELLVKAIGESGTVGLLTGEIGTSAELARTAGITDYLKDYPGIRIVEKQPDNWTDDSAVAAVQAWAAAYPKGSLSAVMAEGPEVAAAAEWARGQGRDDITFIAGDYDTAVQKAIVDGAVYGTVVQYPKEQGEKAIEAIFHWLNGAQDKVQRPTAYTSLPTVTQEDAATTPPAYQ